MNITEFNDKWKNHLEEGFYGMEVNETDVIDYIDREFEKEVIENKLFEYCQIKLKFGYARVYTNSDKNNTWEEGIDKIIRSKN